MPIDENGKTNIATIQVDYNQVTPITLGAKISKRRNLGKSLSIN